MSFIVSTTKQQLREVTEVIVVQYIKYFLFENVKCTFDWYYDDLGSTKELIKYGLVPVDSGCRGPY